MKIKLHLDHIIYQLQRQGGVSRYWKELTKRIQTSEIFQIRNSQDIKINRYSPVYTNADIFHSSYYRLPLGKKVKNVVTIHDFIYELGYIKNVNQLINILQLKFAIKAADAIICVSENTKKDLLLIYPNLINHQNIYTIAHGSSFKFNANLNKQPPVRILNNITKTRQYILFVGKRLKYKNFDNAIFGFYQSCLPKLGFSMICVGEQFSETENKLFKRLQLLNKISVFENITHEELNYLYQNAFALLYPSLYEGFGLPPLEAMSCGCPVIASNTSSIPEVVGSAGILINPNDTQAIASALESLLCNETRDSYVTTGYARAKLFSWEENAQKHIEIYKSLVTK